METEDNQIGKKPVAIIGAGHSGLAMAGHMVLMGYTIHLYDRGEERLWGVRSIGGHFGQEGTTFIRSRLNIGCPGIHWFRCSEPTFRSDDNINCN